MPIFEYICTKCGQEFEELIFDTAAPPCPACGSAKTRKLMSLCSHSSGKSGGEDAYTPPSSPGGSCVGCAGGNCASCGH
ncbi:MAG: FmdB family regulatory protein [Candidatus Desulfovibrio kirbyi]|uniref:FmdB family regulatory protein n=1 Tax=Candidatus Desulfovibrio kirbyi TaxID=2696086 RepID=A0A6L2R532_9BACT|nr:zinc ribbon domain-containing protein [Desulfovibrio sp.]GFH62696.1 MAG: FmdB family regulatory protein [Candidatus Desulfovibrio kirbyi]